MCGIVAALGFSAERGRRLVERGLAALHHRGPDGAGLVAHDGVALGHARLAVTAPDDGAQPLTNEDGTLVAVVNGEIYGYAAARAALERAGHRLTTRSDSELLVHLWEDEGERALARLTGEFACLLWDARRRRLFAARDRFGVKPLAYATLDGGVVFASEAKGLFAMGVPARWDHGALLQVLSLQYPLVERTLFSGVTMVRPGEVVEVDGDAVRAVATGSTRRFATTCFPPASEQTLDDPRGAEAALAHALDAAVAARVRADAPVCVQLSGGVDSSVVAALSARYLGGRLPCFTVAFDDAAYDERALAVETAEMIGGDLELVRVTPRTLTEALPAAVAQGEGVAINAHLPAKFLLSRAMRARGFKVVLTGEGADEVLAGYAHLRRDRLAATQDVAGTGPAVAGAHLAATNGASAGLMLPSGASLPLGPIERALGFVPTWLLAKGTLGYRVAGLMSEEGRRAAEAHDAPARFAAALVEAELAGRSRVDQSLQLWSSYALSGYILRTLGDGMEMAHSMEGRVPFLDPTVFDVARRIPDGVRIFEGREKHPLRAMARGLVPERVRTREKHPFLAPPLVGSPALSQLARDAGIDALPFVDARRVARAFDDVAEADRATQIAWEPALMLVVTAALLGKAYGL